MMVSVRIDALRFTKHLNLTPRKINKTQILNQSIAPETPSSIVLLELVALHNE